MVKPNLNLTNPNKTIYLFQHFLYKKKYRFSTKIVFIYKDQPKVHHKVKMI